VKLLTTGDVATILLPPNSLRAVVRADGAQRIQTNARPPGAENRSGAREKGLSRYVCIYLFLCANVVFCSVLILSTPEREVGRKEKK
jgi:hypothetical protein